MKKVMFQKPGAPPIEATVWTEVNDWAEKLFLQDVQVLLGLRRTKILPTDVTGQVAVWFCETTEPVSFEPPDDEVAGYSVSVESYLFEGYITCIGANQFKFHPESVTPPHFVG